MHHTSIFFNANQGLGYILLKNMQRLSIAVVLCCLVGAVALPTLPNQGTSTRKAFFFFLLFFFAFTLIVDAVVFGRCLLLLPSLVLLRLDSSGG
jgi:hypothetical protein